MASYSIIDRIGTVLVIGLLVVIIFFVFLPIFTTIMVSFDPRANLAYLPPPGISLRWYEDFLGTPAMTRGLRTSLIIGSISTVFSVLIGILASYALVRYNFKGKEALNTIFLSPLVVPGIVTGFALLGFMSSLQIRLSFERLLVAHIIITLPYTIRMISATLFGLDISVEEAAMNLGARPLRVFFDVTLAAIKPGLIAGAVFAFAMSLDDVAVSVFLVDATTSTLPVTLFSYMKANFSPTTAAASVLLLGFTFIFIFVIDKSIGIDKFVGI